MARTARAPAPAPGSASAELSARPVRAGWLAAARRRLASARRRLTAEHVVALLLGLGVLAVHDVPYLLGLSYWLDEGWEAVTTRFPLSQLPAVTSSTPIGWSALLRLVTVPRTQSGRLLPLAFAGAAVMVAYWLARQLGWPQRSAAVCAGVLAGVGALLVPADLIRDDLNQYTADACLSLVVLALTSRLERDWSRKRLIALSVACWGGMLFSHAVTFVGIAAFAALCLTQLAQRSWRRLVESSVAAAVTAVLMLAVYLTFDARAVSAGLINGESMRYYFMPRSSLNAALEFVASRFAHVGHFFGLGPVWLAFPLVAAGMITIFRLGRPATALTVAALWPVALAVNAVRRYPFLEERTNTYLFAITAVVAAIGLVGVCTWLPRVALRRSGLERWVRRWFSPGELMTVWLASVGVIAVIAFGLAARPYVRTEVIPNQNVRGQTQYVRSHEAGDDVILVDTPSSYGFAYYWPAGQPAQRHDINVAQQYVPYFPGQPRIVVVLSGAPADVGAALSRAVAQSRSRSCSRIWFVTSQEDAARWTIWQAALARKGLSAAPVTGVAGLYAIQVTGPRCR